MHGFEARSFRRVVNASALGEKKLKKVLTTAARI
jgi:hypothetical protein